MGSKNKKKRTALGYVFDGEVMEKALQEAAEIANLNQSAPGEARVALIKVALKKHKFIKP